MSQAAKPVVRAHRPDYRLLVFMLALMTIGIVMSVAVGVRRAAYMNNTGYLGYENSYIFLREQIIAVAMGLGGFIVAAKVSVNKVLLKLAGIWLLGAFLLNIVLAISVWSGASLAHCSRGACRWLDVGPTTIQPAELLKLGLVLFFAMFFARRTEEGSVTDLKTILWVIAVAAPALFLVVIVQSDLGSGLSIAAITLVMWLVAGLKPRMLAIVVAIAAALVGLTILVAPYRMRRITTYLDTATNPTSILTNYTDDAYQLRQAMIAVGSGGLLGVGAGNAVQATSYLPEPLSDAVFASLGEVFGLLGCLIVLVLFGLLGWRLLAIANLLDNTAERLIVAGCFAWLVGQALINIMALTALIPLTGVTLPFISSGGTSMLASCVMLGAAFQLSKYTRREQ
ncbi:MAG: FtsW/RodA/SpoVE family cell cycle protein [Candidatus Nomurabacteria bacterium]|jgi:cell division protein FtsW|nr:FtsW/RodA/SpoVE family cell cycle protein [Candidatus Nomurabacteria bacterium]